MHLKLNFFPLMIIVPKSMPMDVGRFIAATTLAIILMEGDVGVFSSTNVEERLLYWNQHIRGVSGCFSLIFA